MSANIPFIFKSAPSISSYTNPAMPCYDCSMLGYSMTCTSCSPFVASTPPTTPSSPATQIAFNFDFSAALANIFPVTEPPFIPKYSMTVTEQPRPRWTSLEPAEPSKKKSRFDWSEMGFSNSQNTFKNSTRSSVSSGCTYDKPCSECPVCSLVPYGALCTSCNQIQTSKATPFPTAWPTANNLGTQQGTQAPEEEQLLQNLDMQLFDQLNFPHKLDDRDRRVYNDSGNCLLYYQDEDGNAVNGYEAWYPSSIIDDCEDPREWHPNSHVYAAAAAAAAEYEASYAPYEVYACRATTDIDDDMTVISGDETWYSCAETIEDEQDEPPTYLTMEQYDSMSMLGFEQRRFSEFLAAQDEELPRFSSDGERIAAWIANTYVAVEDDDEDEGEDDSEEDVVVWDLEDDDVVSQWSEIF